MEQTSCCPSCGHPQHYGTTYGRRVRYSCRFCGDVWSEAFWSADNRREQFLRDDESGLDTHAQQVQEG